MDTNVQVQMRSLRKFAQEAKINGIKSKSAFVKWFREVKGGSAAQSRLYDAWRTSDVENTISPLKPLVSEKEDKENPLEENIKLNHKNVSSFTRTHELIQIYKDTCKSGSFYLNKNESIDRILTENNVPNEYGIYIIYSIDKEGENIIYIGKAGSMGNNGDFKQQGLKGRLKAVHGDVPRKKYFQQVIQDHGFDKLRFLWIVTFDDNKKELPAYSEAKMIQAYFDEKSKLPLLNKSI